MPIGLGAAMIGSAGIGAVGSGKSSEAASDAAGVQARAADNAAKLQYNALQQTRGTLAPFVGAGQDTLGVLRNNTVNIEDRIGNKLTPLTDSLGNISPFSATPNFVGPVTTTANTVYPTTTGATTPSAFNFGAWGPGGAQATLESTPGYQFTRDQGLRAVQNSEAAKGRGVSGNALTAASEYATGLADKTFGEQFTRAREGQGQAYNQTLTGQQQQFSQGLGSATQDLANQQQRFNQSFQGQQLYGEQAPNFYNTFLRSILDPQQQRYSQTSSNITLPINSLLPVAGLGANAAAGTGNAIGSAATNAGNLLTSGAAARAGGIVGSSNALTSGFNNAGNALTNYAWLDRFGFLDPKPSYGTGGLY